MFDISQICFTSNKIVILVACDCYRTSGCVDSVNKTGCGYGCIVTQAPPHGYKCSCEKFDLWINDFPVCKGTPVKCDSPDDDGCNDGQGRGCTEMKCCLGTCDGYRFDGGRWRQWGNWYG